MKRAFAALAALALLLIATAETTREVHAKPYDVPPTWATIRSPLLGRDVYLLTSDLASVGRWGQPRATRMSEPDSQVNSPEWRSFSITRYFVIDPEGPGPYTQVWAAPETYYFKRAEGAAYARNQSFTILDRQGKDIGGGYWAPDWFRLDGPEGRLLERLLEKYEQAESHPARFLKFSCQWIAPGEPPAYRSRVLPSCQ